MNTAEAEIYLRCQRPGRTWEDPHLAQALRASRSDPALGRMLQEQGSFDERITEAVHAISMPAALKPQLEALVGSTAEASDTISPRLMQLAILAVIFGLIVIVGLGISTEMDRRANFPGRETVAKIVATAEGMSGAELDPVSKPLREMDDWFFMRGFDGFTVPKELEGLPGMGARVFRYDGKRVAQVAVDHSSSLLYVFRAKDLEVEIPEGAEWRVVERDGWVGALRRTGDLCVVIAFRGTGKQMRAFLRTIEAPV